MSDIDHPPLDLDTCHELAEDVWLGKISARFSHRLAAVTLSKRVQSLEAENEALWKALIAVCNKVEKQTKVTESIIVRDAHPDNKMSDGSHIIQTLNIHIYDAISSSRAALSNEPEKE